MAARRPQAGRWTRRQLLETTAGAALVGYLLEACAPKTPAAPTGPAAAATAAPPAAATTAPAAATTAPAAAATIAPAAAAATSKPAAAAGASGGQAIISFGEPDTLLVSESRALVGAYIRSFIANGLVRLKYPDMTVVEDLADKYSVSPDSKTYTFELHPGVKWHDGQPFTTDDVKFTSNISATPTMRIHSPTTLPTSWAHKSSRPGKPTRSAD
jgi:peptide/nickel transport system substrate-binding protein